MRTQSRIWSDKCLLVLNPVADTGPVRWYITINDWKTAKLILLVQIYPLRRAKTKCDYGTHVNYTNSHKKSERERDREGTPRTRIDWSINKYKHIVITGQFKSQSWWCAQNGMCCVHWECLYLKNSKSKTKSNYNELIYRRLRDSSCYYLPNLRV